MNKSFNKVIKSHLFLSVLSVFSVVLLMTGVTYALFQIEDKNAENQTISIGNLDVGVSSTSGTITLSDIYPTKMAELPASNPKYSFTISNSGDYGINYTIYLSDNTTTFLSGNPSYNTYKPLQANYYKYIDYRMDGSNTAKNLAQIYNSSTGKMPLKSGYLSAGATETHTIEFWMDSGDTNVTGAPNDIIGSILALNINLEGSAGTLNS